MQFDTIGQMPRQNGTLCLSGGLQPHKMLAGET
jgi:hypothetical protein